LRVEYKDAAGNWHGATQEWLKLGFARGLTPPNSVGANTVHPNAILLLQMLADRDGSATINGSAESSSATTSPYNWYPINFYDTREGEIRDTTTGKTAATCSPNGVIKSRRTRRG